MSVVGGFLLGSRIVSARRRCGRLDTGLHCNLRLTRRQLVRRATQHRKALYCNHPSKGMIQVSTARLLGLHRSNKGGTTSITIYAYSRVRDN